MATSGEAKSKSDLKIIVLGAANVGKTCLLQRYLTGEFAETISSIGASLALKRWNNWNVALWDTAGEERYASLSSFYCRGADVAILSFDLTDRKSLSRLQEVFIPLLHDSVRSCLTVVVGTKLDLASSGGRQVKSSDGRRLAEEQHRQMSEKAMARDPNSYLVNVSAKKLYFETSAKSGDGISEIFEFIQSVVVPELEKQGGGEARKKNRSITLGESDAMRGGPKCCHKS